MSLGKFAAVAFAGLAASLSTAAAETIDQQQPLIDVSAGYLGVGGDSEQKLAQTFRVGMDGNLIALDLPVDCGGGDLIVEIRRQSSGRPTGAVLRTIRASLTALGTADFRRLYLPTRLAVSRGDELAFTVQVEEGGNCNYATSPTGDTYPRGDGFFDSRPNPPGWLAFKGLDPFNDLPFKTIMEDAGDRRANRCVIPGEIDPSTGAPLTLPISRDVPACRCFQDSAAREFRCGILHPDFFALRRIPWPLTPGKPYEEIWEFSPVTQLDGPVRMTLEGAGRYKPVYRDFGYKAEPGQTETVRFKAVAPKSAENVLGVAAFQYKMEDAPSPFAQEFGLDTSIGPENYK